MAVKKKNLKKKTAETRRIERLLNEVFPNALVDAYRYSQYSIRVRVIDAQFRGLNRIQRADLVEPHLEKLPEETQMDIMILLLLAPGEEDTSPANWEFEKPLPPDY